MTLEDAISTYGGSLKAKLSSPAIDGTPEDQLRTPLVNLFEAGLADLCGLPGVVTLVGETALNELKSRPDFAVTVRGALVGFIEVKAPGKGADPRRFSDPHDKAQWGRLKSLPNILYTSGDSFSLWQDGELQGRVIDLDGEAATAGAQAEGAGRLPAVDQRLPDVAAVPAQVGEEARAGQRPPVPPAARRGGGADGARQRGADRARP